MLCIVSFAANHGKIANDKPLYKGAEYKSGTLVLKVKAAFRSSCSKTDIAIPAVQMILTKISASGVFKKFPNFKMPSSGEVKSNRKPVDMSLVYQVNFSPVVRIESALQDLMSTGIFEYAEPLYIHQLDFVPNDPQVASQYYISKINAYAAWDVCQGDTNVVIAIVDSGTDWNHPDLEANIKYNYADPIDGMDNDNDGFIDNFRGWDVSGNDNDPMVGVQSHGSHVSGCADAITNNSVGISGPAYKCKFLPVKSALDASASSIDDGYDGITYAADHGVNVINCSWGRAGAKSQFEQDAINYATINHDALVVAAAGNNFTDQEHFPSSYDNVISVAATTSTDGKSSFSNYNATVDVCAPGSGILSTIFDDTYASQDGTSMASPIAAGCAAMIKARFPALNALQVGEQLRTTCHYIYNVSGNSAYLGKLGKGRVDLYNAVTDSVSPGVILRSSHSTDNDDDVFLPGDTLSVSGLFENLLRPTANLTCSLATSSTYVQILQPNFNAGVLNTMDTVSNYGTGVYRVYIKPTAPLNTEVVFRVILTDGTWNDTYLIKIIVNVDYINIAINNVTSSITSKSLLGYNQTGQTQGLGFTYMGSPSILYDMGLMVGAQGLQVSDNTRNGAGANDEDFSSVVNVAAQEPGIISDIDVHGIYEDNGPTSAAPLNVSVRHNAYAWIASPDDNYIMVQYYIKNNSTDTLNNLYAGVFADWDIPLYSNNKCATDLTRRMGYIWSTDVGGLWAGIKLLSHTGGFNHYALDNVTTAGSINLGDGFDDTEKYTAMSTSRSDAGTASTTGNDVLSVVSSGNFNLAQNDSVEVAFALVAGGDLSDIQTAADAAQIMYDNKFVGIFSIGQSKTNELFQSYPNPADKNARIDFALKNNTACELNIYNVMGSKISTVVSEKLTAGKYSVNVDVSKFPAGNYFYRLVAGDFTNTHYLTIVH